MSRPVWPEIARLIEDEIAAGQPRCLPSMPVLASRLGVSVQTVSRATAHLREKGVVVYGQGSRITVGERARAMPDTGSPPDAAGRAFRWIHQRIREGEFRVGMPLPKARFLAFSLHASPNTLAQAFRRLVAAGEVHRRGRHLLVGPHPKAGNVSVGIAREEVLWVVVSHKKQWRSLARDPRTHPFAQSFVGEADRQGVRLELVVEEKSAHTEEGVVHTPESIKSYRRRLGERYRGALLAMATYESRQFHRWHETLARLGEPMAWLDRSASSPATPCPGPHVYRCVSPEEPVAAAAIRFLCGHGHRDILYLATGENDWQQRRLESLREAARAPDTPVILRPCVSPTRPAGDPAVEMRYTREISTVRNNVVRRAIEALTKRRAVILRRFGRLIPGHLHGHDFAEFAAVNRAASADRGALSKDEREALAVIWAAWALRSLWAYPSITAVIAPNDTIAASYHEHWLRAVGFGVPADISLLSFDNAGGMDFRPLSSVDHGFGLLGYMALHAILGDVPVKADRTGVIAATPTVVARRSVGRPVLRKPGGRERRWGRPQPTVPGRERQEVQETPCKDTPAGYR